MTIKKKRRQAATKFSRYVGAARIFSLQLSALMIIDLRNFIAKRKEVMDKESILSGASGSSWSSKGRCYLSSFVVRSRIAP